MSFPSLSDLVTEYERSLSYTADLFSDLSATRFTGEPETTPAPSAGISATKPLLRTTWCATSPPPNHHSMPNSTR